ncbi:MAG: hypothetical protein M3R25_09115, partial [Bacteroidota bacterium]|nr:hypothetical protein [Bacteroidota bacterium]
MTFHLQAQVIYLSTNTEDIFRLDIVTCQYELVVHLPRPLTDITFHPDGTFYGVNNNGLLFEIDTLTGNTNNIHDFGGQIYNSLTTSAEGIIYTTGDEGELWTYDKSADVATYLGDFGYRATGDLTFYKGGLYVAVQNDRIVKIDIANPPNSSVVVDGNIQGEVFGIVSYTAGCDSINCYALSSGTSEIYLINFTDMSLELVCNLDIQAGGGASTYEFLGSTDFEIDTVIGIEPSCNGNDGSLTSTVIGNAGAVLYSINGGVPQSSSTFSNLPGGQYLLKASDENGCTDTLSIMLTNLNGPMITNVTGINTTCGNENGSINIQATATTTLTYSIDGVTFQTSSFFENLPVGLYDVIVEDANGCQASDMLEIIPVPTVSIDSVKVTSALCDDNEGSITIFSNFTTEVNYSIDGILFQPQSVFEQLLPGNFTVIAEDLNGCRDTTTATISSGIPVVITNLITEPTSCGLKNGTVAVEASGGSGQLSYIFNSLPVQISGILTDLAAGTYEVIVTDTMGCTASANFQIAPSVGLLLENLEAIPGDCGISNGSVIIEVSGGTGLVTSLMDNIGSPDNNVFSNLAAGNYYLHISDETGCRLDTSLRVTHLKCGIYIPNTFSPNGDGINDFFMISTLADVPIT